MTARRIRFGSLLIVSALWTPALAGTPSIGDKAPPVSIAKWMTAMPPALPGGPDASKFVFLVEFWATWCPPCKISLPHLDSLHKEYREKGLVVMGITNEEEETIAEFLKKRPLTYYVGSDDHMKTTQAWMENVPGIPHAFLVDREGVVLWTGNPLDTNSMDGAIKQVLDGRLTVKTAKAAQAAAERDAMYQIQHARLLRARSQQNADVVFKTLDEMIRLKPERAEPYLAKRQMLDEFGRRSELSAFDETMEAALGGSLEGMLDLCEAEFARDLPNRNPQRLLRYVEKAEQLCDSKDPRALSMSARARWEIRGDLGEAIEMQRKAAEAAPETEREPYQKTLEYFESLKEIQGSGSAEE